MRYVFILGPCDSVLVGPFLDLRRAKSFCDAHFASTAAVPAFDLYIWSHDDYMQNVREFGPLETVSVYDYIAAGGIEAGSEFAR